MRSIFKASVVLSVFFKTLIVFGQTSQQQTIVYPEPYWGVDLGGEAGEFGIPDPSGWSEKQRFLYENGRFVFNSNTALAVTKDGMYGVIDENKNWVVKPIYTDISEISGSRDKLMVKDETNWGVINYRGRELISMDYEVMYIRPLCGSLIAKKTNGFFGMVNFYNETVVDFIYDELRYSIDYDTSYNEFQADVVLIAAKKNGKWGFVDSTGVQILPFEYDDVSGGFTQDLVGVKKDSLWGYMDRTGKLVIPLQFKCAYSFFAGDAVVSSSSDEEDYESRFRIDKYGNKLDEEE